MMSFEFFLVANDSSNVAWEIFKGISPTIVALLTIWINTIISKRKAEKDNVLAEIKELQLMVANLSAFVVETGEYLLETIQNADDKQKSEEMFENYYSKNNQMLKESRKFLAYANMRAEIFNKENMIFTNASDAITDYSHELIAILEWYNNKATETSREYFDKLCDEVQKKLINSTSKVEGIMFNYCINLSK